jgi:hypothetical protein
VTVLRPVRMRNTSAMLLALLALGIAGPSRARAGCLYPHGTAPGRGVAHLDRLALAGALSVPIDEAAPSQPVRPCAGMRCSNDPAPAPPSAPVVAPGAEQWGHLMGARTGPDSSGSPLPSNDRLVRPRHRGPSPFHPPR